MRGVNLDERDRRVLTCLREDCRMRLADISARTGIPISTVHERIRKLLRDGMMRPAPLLDFPACGLPLHYWIVVESRDRESVRRTLCDSVWTNTALSLGTQKGFLVEAVFPDFMAKERFAERVGASGWVHWYPVIETVAREHAVLETDGTA